MAGFSVNIGADTAELTKGLAQSKANVKSFLDAFDESTAAENAMKRLSAEIDKMVDSSRSMGVGFKAFVQDIDALRSANTSPFDKLRKSAADVPPAVDKATDSLHRFKDGLRTPPDSKVISSIDNTTKTLGKVPASSNAASLALTNVGRVAQDLPFGFIGIQNNLNPLLESFQRLKAETGSGKEALKALGSSLIGAGGIGLALSIVTSAIVIAQNGIAGFNKKTKEAKEASDELKKVIRDIGTIQGESIASTQGQIAVVNALTTAVLDETRSQKERKNALEQLKETNKSYFGDLTLESSQLAILKTRVEEYTQALIRQAVVKGFEEDIVNVKKEQVKADKEAAKARLALADAQKDYNDTKASSIDTQEGGELIAQQTLLHSRERLNVATEANRKASETVTRLKEQELILTNEINNAVLKGLNLSSLSGGKNTADKEDPVLKALKKELAGYQKQLETTNKLREAGLLPLFRENDALELQLKILDTLSSIDAREVALKTKPKLEIDPVLHELEITKAYKEYGERSKHRPIQIPIYVAPKPKIDVQVATKSEKAIDGTFDALLRNVLFETAARVRKTKEQIEKELSENIFDIKIQGRIDAISTLADSLGEALTSSDFLGGLKKAAQSMLGILGSVMQQIGRQIITAAIQIKYLKATVEKWAIANPALAILAGAGLIAAGAALRNVKFEGPKFANGGIVTGPVIGQIGEMHRPEVIMPLDRLPQMMAQMGGGSGGDWQMIPIVNNDGLYLAVKRGERSVGRKF